LFVNFIRKKFVRLNCLWFLVTLVLYGQLCLGKGKVDPVLVAKELIANKERRRACDFLSEALGAPGLKAEDKNRLESYLDRFSKMFFSEKGQQLFQWGESLYSADPKTAIKLSREPVFQRIGY